MPRPSPLGPPSIRLVVGAAFAVVTAQRSCAFSREGSTNNKPNLVGEQVLLSGKRVTTLLLLKVVDSLIILRKELMLLRGEWVDTSILSDTNR